MTYDKNNIFAKILRGEIPCKKIYENKYVLAFYDINPQKSINFLSQFKMPTFSQSYNRDNCNLLSSPVEKAVK